MPADYNDASLHHPLTRQLMAADRISRTAASEYDDQYPDGIPDYAGDRARRAWASCPAAW